MKQRTRFLQRFALLLAAAFTATTAWATVEKTNPVTGETENYTWKFVGTDTWNGTQYWQNSDSTPPVGVPAKSGDSSWGGSDDHWLPILFDGNTIQINAGMSVEGWNLRMGLYNGANITLQHLVKLQSGVATWFTVDENSTLTIAGMDNNKLEGSNPLCLYSARANGITWTPALSNSAIGDGVQMPIYYYLAGDGTVAFNGGITLTSAQVIKRADVTLSEATSSKTVRSKTLVSFASTSTSTFSADAETTIKVKNSDGTALKDVNLTSVTATDTTLTTAGDVGDCELVQTSTGILLYYVDYANTYKPSININFTNGAGNGLTTSADVGLDGYAVPGTSWNNFVVANNTTFNTVNAIDSTGAASVASGVSVSISGTRGHWNCSSLTPASNPLHGYIDESADGPTPTVTITGIPYEHYRVIVYHSTDQNGAKFGYDTINGFNFTYVNGVQQTGTTSWGNAGASNSAEPIAEGVNTLVSAVLSGDTVTMVAHRIGGGSPSARGCFAAIQVVEYVPEVGENDLEIAVEGATEHTVTADEAAKTGTVYLTGAGTLTLSGSEKITAATIDVAKDVVLNINADRLDATTFTGAGTVVYDTTAPVEGKGWANIGWSGTVWIKNQSVSSFEGTKFGNAASTVRFTGVTGFLQTSSYNSSTYVHTVPLELVDEGNTVAFTYNDGWGGNLVKINTLKGTGTLYTEDKGSGEHIYIVDASGFSGVFNLTTKYVYVGGSQPDYSASANPGGKLEIRSGVTMTVPSGKTWTANGGFVVNGTLNVNGTLASSHTTKAVSGAGTVVFTGRAPTVSGDAWWKNADWTGTVQVKDVTNMVGDSRTGVWLKFNDYGNSGSVVEMNNVTGWLETGYTCTPKIKITGTLYLNNGGSGKASAFKVGTLLGSGTISGGDSAPTVVFNVTDDWSGFTGTFGLNNKCIVFGETIPDTLTAGTIYVSEGAVVTPQQASGTWWAVGGIKVDGELRAPNLNKFGGGTTITTTDNGIFTLTTSANTNDSTTDYARITGTGTLRYADASNIWRALSQNNFPTGMICENNLSEGLVLPTPNAMHTIGSLAGSGKIRSDFSSGNRNLTILQAKDTTWSGLFGNDDRVGSVTVDSGASSTGTLTLSGIQTHDNSLTVNGSVNLTGTWKGATTVSGTFGGTGTVTGNLTFSNGATFKANASPLTVSGAVTFADGDEESVTIDATGITPAAEGTTVLSGASISLTESKVVVPDAVKMAVVDGTTLKLYPVAAIYNGTKYTTFEAAIEAAGVANLASITVVDGTATLPDGYYIDGARVKLCEASITISGVTTYKNTVLDAAMNASMTVSVPPAYEYITIRIGGEVSMPAFATEMRIKNEGKANISFSTVTAEVVLSIAEGETYDTYTVVPTPTTYTWTDAYSATDVYTGEDVENHEWIRPGNWEFGDHVTATRCPAAGDAVVLGDGTTVALSANAECATLTLIGSVSVSGAYSLTSASAVSVPDGATLTLAGATLVASNGVTVADGGTLKGNGTISGAVAFADGATLDATAGTVTVSGAVTNSGTLNVEMGEGFTPSAYAGEAAQKALSASASDLPADTVLAATVTADGSAVSNAVVVAKAADGLYAVLKPTVPTSGGDVPEGVTAEMAETIAELAAVAGVETVTYKTTGADRFEPDRLVVFPSTVIGVNGEGQATTSQPTFGIKSLTVRLSGGTNYVIIQAEAHDLADGASIALSGGLTESAAAKTVKDALELTDGTSDGVTTKWFVLDLPGSTTAYGVKATK